MFVLYKPERLLSKIKLIGAIVLLGVFIFYVLPRLLSALWFTPHQDPIYDKTYREPLRVESELSTAHSDKKF